MVAKSQFFCTKTSYPPTVSNNFKKNLRTTELRQGLKNTHLSCKGADRKNYSGRILSLFIRINLVQLMLYSSKRSRTLRLFPEDRIHILSETNKISFHFVRKV